LIGVPMGCQETKFYNIDRVQFFTFVLCSYLMLSPIFADDVLSHDYNFED